jgi:hypothetical protein
MTPEEFLNWLQGYIDGAPINNHLSEIENKLTTVRAFPLTLLDNIQPLEILDGLPEQDCSIQSEPARSC